MEKCYKISGRVQGVGFRYWAIRAAKHIGDISGYICNFSDGDVVAYVAGTEEELNAFYMVLHKGALPKHRNIKVIFHRLKPVYSDVASLILSVSLNFIKRAYIFL